MTEQEIQQALMEVQLHAARLRDQQEHAITLPVTGRESWAAYTQALAKANAQLVHLRHLLEVIGMKLYLDNEALVSRAADHREQMLREEAACLLGPEPADLVSASYMS